MRNFAPDCKHNNTTDMSNSKILCAACAMLLATAVAKAQNGDVTQRELRVGFVLPLHQNNGDGLRMTEYYRGWLLALDSLKQHGYSADIWAWNIPEEGDPKTAFDDPAAARLDLIVGPIYTSQVGRVARFAEEHNIKVVLPFSIFAPQMKTVTQLYQVYQPGDSLTADFVADYVKRFHDCHTVIIDCNDANSQKGAFTSALRTALEQQHMTCRVTNLKSQEETFMKAFEKGKHNMVVLNSGRAQELNMAMLKLNNLVANLPETRISLYGYTDWLMYLRQHRQNFSHYDTYIPSTFHTQLSETRTSALVKKYRDTFGTDMQQALPRFALTGFDHAMFFLQGLHRYGTAFTGSRWQQPSLPLQSPLRFEPTPKGGRYNKQKLLLHYTMNGDVEEIKL